MDIATEKERALTFLRQLENPDRKVLESLLADNFEFEFMTRMEGFAGPPRNRQQTIDEMPEGLKQMFPNGLNLKIITAIAEGPHVAVQAESDTIAATGKHYANRYHFYFRFDGDRIAQVREYNDSNHVREVFAS